MYQKAYDELLMIQNDYEHSLNICEAMDSQLKPDKADGVCRASEMQMQWAIQIEKASKSQIHLSKRHSKPNKLYDQFVEEVKHFLKENEKTKK